MQEKLQAAMAWCTCIVTGKGERSLPAVAERILCSISAQKKIYFKVRRRKINRKMFHLWSVGYLILSGKNVRVHGCIHHCCYFMRECCYETSLPILHKSHFSDMWSLV